MIKNLTLFFSVLILSCSNDNSFTINGNIDALDNTKVYILQADQNNQPYIKDSTTVKSNQFSFKGVSATPQISYMQIEGVNGYVLTILENGLIEADLYIDSISKSQVYGTKSK
jgi:hypothetical protein